MADDDKIFAPFSADEVERINEFQLSGRWHPFTCGNDHSRDEDDSPSLVAMSDGWHCPVAGCDWKQDWAWAFMVES